MSKKKIFVLACLGAMAGSAVCQLVLERFGWMGWIMGTIAIALLTLWAFRQDRKKRT